MQEIGALVVIDEFSQPTRFGNFSPLDFPEQQQLSQVKVKVSLRSSRSAFSIFLAQKKLAIESIY
jgi:hypothetical protein